MGKGLCAGDKSWLGQLSSLGDKINTIMSKATTAVGSMFKDVTVDTAEQKAVRFNQSKLLIGRTFLLFLEYKFMDRRKLFITIGQ
jgi:hypothetical protein